MVSVLTYIALTINSIGRCLLGLRHAARLAMNNDCSVHAFTVNLPHLSNLCLGLTVHIMKSIQILITYGSLVKSCSSDSFRI